MATRKRIDIILGARDKASRIVGGFRRKMVGALKRIAVVGIAAAGVAAAGLAVLVKRAFGAVDATAKLADRLGMATEQLVGFQHAASIAGVSAQELDKALEMFNRRVGEAAMGTGEGKRALENLGLSIKDIMAQKPAERFKMVAEAIRGLDDQSKKASAAADLFGRSGMRLLNTLELGRDGLNAMVEEADRLGLSFSRVDAAKVEMANDAITRMKAAFVGVGRTLAIELAPTVERLADYVREVTQRVVQNIGRALDWVRGAWLTTTAVIGVAIERWGDLAEIVMLKTARGVMYMRDRFVYLFGEVIPALVKWCVGRVTDYGRKVVTFWSNAVKNIVALVKNLPGLIAGTTKWEDIWTPMLQGYKATAQEMVRIAGFQASETSKILDRMIEHVETRFAVAVGRRVSEKLAAWAKLPGLPKALELAGAPGAPGAPGASGAAGRPGRKGLEFLELGPQFRGLAAIFRATEDPMKQTARETAATAKACRDNGRILKDVLQEVKSGGGAVEGVPLFR